MQARKEAASGRTFFIDHNTRATTWDRPPAPKSCPSPPAGPSRPDAAPAAERNGVPEAAGLAGAQSEKPSEGDAEAGGSSEEGAGSREEGEPVAARAPATWGLFGLSVEEVRHSCAGSVCAMLSVCMWDRQVNAAHSCVWQPVSVAAWVYLRVSAAT